MSSASKGWHVPGEDDQPVGPFTDEQIFKRLLAGQLAKNTLCWREGMSGWQPLDEVEPFASALRSRKEAPQYRKDTARPAEVPQTRFAKRPRRRRLVPIVVGLICAIALGAAAYFLVPQWVGVHRARELIAKGLYDDASRFLRRLTAKYPHNDEAVYLYAVAVAAGYACTDENHGHSLEDVFAGDYEPLHKAKRLLSRAIAADSKWAEEARSEFAEISGRVPSHVPDAVVRVLVIANLRGELELADASQLARDVFSALAAHLGDEPDRELKPALVRKVLSWDPALADEILALILPDDYVTPNDASRVIQMVRRLVAEQAALASIMGPALLRQADRFIEDTRYEQAEVLLIAAGKASPALLVDVARKRLAYLELDLKAGNVAGVLAVLDRTNKESPEMTEGAPPLYIQAASQLRTTDRDLAWQALQTALQLGPGAADDENTAFLWIELAPRADEAKLRRCRDFLDAFPDSLHREQVLVMVVTDATAVKQHGRRQRETEELYLTEGETAARELMQQYPKAAGLAERVYDLSKRLANAKQDKKMRMEKALDLTTKLLEEVPVRDALKLEIEQERARWRETLGRTLPPEFDKQIEDIEREFEKLTIVTPRVVRELAEKPDAVHVAEIAPSCTADKFSSEEADLLRNWVRTGGMLWVNNNVLSLFDIGFRRTSGGSTVTHPGTVEHDVLTECQKVHVKWARGQAYNLDRDGVLALLNAEDYTIWSLVPYGNGWISDVKTVDEGKYDGARFWLNFRQFCMGRPIRGADVRPDHIPPPEREELPPERLTVIDTIDDLSEALADIEEQQVIWVRLRKDEVDDAGLVGLKDWVRSGGVLWLQSDLGRRFGFRVGTAKRQEPAEVSQASHDILKGFNSGTRVGYVLSDGFVVIGSTGSLREQRVTPLLSWQRGDVQHSVVCAARSEGNGVVIFRPAEFDTSGAGRRFEENLRTFSFERAQRSRRSSAPEDRESMGGDPPSDRRVSRYRAADRNEPDSGTSSGDSSDTAARSGHIRIRKPGDSWSYDLVRKVGDDGKPFNLSGTLTMRVEPESVADLSGNRAQVFTIATSLLQPDSRTPTVAISQLYLSQDSKGSVYLHGELDDVAQPSVSRFVLAPDDGRALDVVSPLEIGTAVQTNFLEFNDGTVQEGTAVVAAIEEMSVPAGRFRAFRIEGSNTRTSGDGVRTVTHTSWWVPQIGAAVRFVSAVTAWDDNGKVLLTYDEVGELETTTVPLPSP